METKSILKPIVTTGDRLKDLTISNGQLIFLQDLQRIAFDYNGNRKFYNQIEILSNENERSEITPVNGKFYFVLSTIKLWFYQNKWEEITGSVSSNPIFIGTEMPEFGSENNLYVDKKERNISVWDESAKEYVEVADCTDSIDDTAINALFN